MGTADAYSRAGGLMLRVTNQRRWRRTEMVFAAIVTFALLWSMGGLEGYEPMPHPEAAIMLMGVLGYMVHNLTKHYK